MREDIIEALSVIRQACGSVVANLETHQQIQAAILSTEEELKRLYKIEAEQNKVEKSKKTAP